MMSKMQRETMDSLFFSIKNAQYQSIFTSDCDGCFGWVSLSTFADCVMSKRFL